MNIAEKLTTIAENEQKVYNAGYKKGKSAFGVVATEKGTSIRIDHINDAEDVVNVKLSSKNLLPFTPQTIECTTGFYVTINEDGSITLNGESPYMNVIAIHTILSGQKVLKKGKTYTQTLRYADGSIVTNDVAYLSTGADWFKGDRHPTKSLATGNNNVFTVEGAFYDDEYYEHEQFEANIVWQAGTYDNVTVYPQIEENTTATAYTPYVADVSETTLNVLDKNILPYPYYDGKTRTANGVTATVNDDGSITLNGTPTATFTFHIYHNKTKQTLLKKGVTYTLSLFNNPASKNEVYIGHNTSSNGTTWDGGTGASTTGVTSKTFTVAQDYKGIQLYIVVSKNAGTLNNVVVYPQVEVGSKATEWESYKEPTIHTPNTDGTLEIPSISPTMTLATDKQGVNIECEYYLDGQAVIDELTDAIISLGGTI